MGINIDVLKALQQGAISIQGEFMWGSNYTFFTQVDWEGEIIHCVYKPSRGERPLWDFPAATLARREVAAYLVSHALGWNLTPPTIYREDGPIGPGSVQLYIDHDPQYHYFNFSIEDRQRLRPTALLDIIINNADRKGSHILKAKDGSLWLIDHGVCFHEEDKLRTVIWDFVGEPIPEDRCADMLELLQNLRGGPNGPSELAQELGKYLHRNEIAAISKRVEALLVQGVFPEPDPTRRPFPWPEL